MRSRYIRAAAAGLAGALALTAPAAALAATAAALAATAPAVARPASGLAARHRVKTIATFKGRTSQGKRITIKYLGKGKTGYITVKTAVIGMCPVTGLGNATKTTTVSDTAHGPLPIPAKWHFETSKPGAFVIKLSAKVAHHRTMSGKLFASWHTHVDNMPTCTTPTIAFTAKRR